MKVCIIGVGRMGRRHITAVQQLGYQIAGVFDKNEDALGLAVSENSIPEERCYHSAEQMLTESKPEIVIIATTAPSHCEYVCMAAVAGTKYILCEKPMAVSIAECEQMIETCKKHGAKLAVNHQMRFMDQYTKIKALCESKEFGGVKAITVAASNFGLVTNGSHYFEMFRFMANNAIKELAFRMDADKVPNPRGSQYEDRSGQVFALTNAGHRLYMEIGGDLGQGIHVIYGCRYGQIFVDECIGFVRTLVRKTQYQDLPITRYSAPANEESFIISKTSAMHIQDIQRVLQSLINKNNYPDGCCGRQVVSSLVAAYISGENDGKRVKLEDVLCEDTRRRQFHWA